MLLQQLVSQRRSLFCLHLVSHESKSCFLWHKFFLINILLCLLGLHASHFCWFKCLFKISLIKLLPLMLHPSKSSVSFEVIPDLHPHISDLSMQEVGFGLCKNFQTGLIPSNRLVCNSRCGW